jgi:hypothetical protein
MGRVLLDLSEAINSPARERQRRRWLGNRFRSCARPRPSAAVLARQQVQVVRLTYRCVPRYSCCHDRRTSFFLRFLKAPDGI